MLSQHVLHKNVMMMAKLETMAVKAVVENATEAMAAESTSAAAVVMGWSGVDGSSNVDHVDDKKRIFYTTTCLLIVFD